MRLRGIAASFAFFSLSFILILIACAGSAEKRNVETTVREYNNALIKAFAAMDFEALKAVTTGREYNKVSIYIMSYAGQDEKFNARLLRLDIRKIRVHGNNADAVTSEEWEYEKVNATTGEVVRQKTLYVYEMNYHLLKDKGTWKVDQLTILKESEKR